MSSPDGADIPQVAVDMLTGLLRAGDADSAQQFVATLLSGGTSRVEVIDGLLGPALARIGQLWQDGGVSVAVEHRATNIVDALLHLTLQGVSAAVQGRRVLLTGVQGEWHVMPARLVAGVWNCLGWEVVALTPSLPADDLRALAAAERTRIAGVSCSLVSNLVPAWQTISVLRGCGYRVVVGGRAFDAVADVAQILGADAHERDPVRASNLLATWVYAAAMPSRQAAREQQWAQIEPVWCQLPKLVEQAMVVATELAEVAMPAEVTRQDLTLIARTSCAAALTGKMELLGQHMRWYATLMDSTGTNPATGQALLWSLDRVLPAGDSIRAVLAAV
jgi:methanogenic corrinoid protein MtbC1